MKADNFPKVPKYFDLLSHEDREQYYQLQKTIHNENRARRNQKCQELQFILDKIKEYVNHDNENHTIRALVSGVAFFDGYIAINIPQLQTLIHKCKSSINTTLRALNYQLIHNRCDACPTFIQRFPQLHSQPSQLRLWTLRSNQSYEFCQNLIAELRQRPNSSDSPQLEIECDPCISLDCSSEEQTTGDTLTDIDLEIVSMEVPIMEETYDPTFFVVDFI